MIAPETMDAILIDVAAGEPVRKAIAAHQVNPRAFYCLLGSDDEAAKRYARAKETGCHAVADETVELQDEQPPMVQTQHGEHVDSGWVQWQKNRVELRRWHLAKLLPKKYGDKLDLGSDPDRPLITKVIREIVRTPD